MPFFSVITPSFNQGKFIATCLDSVRSQGDDDYEHLIFDNCSTDETPSVLANYATQSQIKLVIESDQGQSEAVNKGFQRAGGEIICWLNSDDAYMPGTFARLRKAFADPKVQVVFGDTKQISYDGRPPERAVGYLKDRYDLLRWWHSKARLHQPSIFFRRSVREKCGLLKNDLHYAMDYEYWWRMTEYYDFHYIPEELALQYRQPDSKTMKAWGQVLEEREKIFSPFYALLGEKPAVLKKEKSQALAAHYLLQAYAVISSDRSAAWGYFCRAVRQSPCRVVRCSTLGLIRKFCFL